MEDHCHIQTDYHTNGDSRRSQVRKQCGNAVRAFSHRHCDHQQDSDGSDSRIDDISRMIQFLHALICHHKCDDQGNDAETVIQNR